MNKALTKSNFLIIVIILINIIQTAQCDITVWEKDLTVKIDNSDTFKLQVRNFIGKGFTINFYVQNTEVVIVEPRSVFINESKDFDIKVTAIGAGHSEIIANASNSNTDLKDVYLRVTVYKVDGLDTFSTVIGWIYFVAWSLSFYPQVYVNFRRKSVIGLNFDFLLLNIVGFSLYAIFNFGLYLIPEVKDEYFNRYPRGLNPVQVNDIVFAVLAVMATLITTAQCFIYERSDQKISVTAQVILGVSGLFLFISIILAGTNVILWLDFLYYCSYVKLGITIIKYIPQAYMNFRRKSTDGWVIGNVFFDFVGGVSSMLQMIVNSYNYDDWASILGDPTKFGLGLFSAAFDILFFVQHYILYRHHNSEKILNDSLP